MTAINSVADLQARFGFDTSNSALNAALGVVANSATQALTVVMRTEFDAVVGQADIFSPRSMIRNGELYECKLKLSQGFIDPSSVAITYGSSLQQLQTGSPSTLSSNFFIDTEKGVITVLDVDFTAQGWDFRRLVPGMVSVGPGYMGLYIQVMYNAGFEETGGVYSTQLVNGSPQPMPSWLLDAGAARALVDLDENYPAYRADRAASAPDLMRRKDRIVQNLGRKLRYVPNGEIPLGV